MPVCLRPRPPSNWFCFPHPPHQINTHLAAMCLSFHLPSFSPLQIYKNVLFHQHTGTFRHLTTMLKNQLLLPWTLFFPPCLPCISVRLVFKNKHCPLDLQERLDPRKLGSGITLLEKTRLPWVFSSPTWDTMFLYIENIRGKVRRFTLPNTWFWIIWNYFPRTLGKQRVFGYTLLTKKFSYFDVLD